MAPKITHLPYFIPEAPDYSAVNEGYALFAGRLTVEKGISTLLEAAAKLKHIRLVVAGEGPLLEDSKRFVRRQQISNVEFTGYMDGTELEGLLRGAGCVVVPSVWYENLPLTILGAFARGVPVVASARGGNPELVREGVTGYLAEPGNADSLADSLNRILINEKARLEMGRRARNLVAAEYSPVIHYERLMSLYRGLCK
jgi:glycosyltransferase involved in cell wall biosynthesis